MTVFHINLVGRKDLGGEIYRQVRRAILDRRLRPGDPLPPGRELARALAVSRGTVTVAYERLAAEGFVISRQGSGTFVSELVMLAVKKPKRRFPDALQPRPMWDAIALPPAFETDRFDFRTGRCDASLFPHRSWRRSVNWALRVGENTLGIYEHPAGNRDLREAIARHVGISRGIRASADDIIVTNGAQQAVDVLTRVLMEPGERMAVEDPSYGPPRLLFKTLGIRVVGAPVDHQGLVVAALPRGIRAVYVTPSHQFPLSVTMTLPRRQALLAWAERNSAAIIEDDYDGEFRFGGRPLEPLQTLDEQGRVIYVGSFSKTMLPTFRLGFLVAPRSLREALHRAKFVSDWHSSTLAQAALARFIDTGEFARHVRRVSTIYRERHQVLSDAITRDFAEHLKLIPSATGLHLTALARRMSVTQIGKIVRRAGERGVTVQDLSRFAVGKSPQAGIMMGYSAIPTASIEKGMGLLRECFDSKL